MLKPNGPIVYKPWYISKASLHCDLQIPSIRQDLLFSEQIVEIIRSLYKKRKNKRTINKHFNRGIFLEDPLNGFHSNFTKNGPGMILCIYYFQENNQSVNHRIVFIVKKNRISDISLLF